jgi:hypothetical protein
MDNGQDVRATELLKEIARIAELAGGMFCQLEEFTRSHASQVLLGAPLRVQAATELACIISDCRSITESLARLTAEPCHSTLEQAPSS